MQQHTTHYIDGRWRDTVGPERIEVLNPATGHALGSVPAAIYFDVDAAVAAAREALPGWRATAPVERAAALRRIADGLRERAEDIAQCISAEMGMPIRIARRIQATLPVEVFEATATARG